MTACFVENLDYILFVYGLGFVLLAITLLGLRATVTSPLPWKWLGVSAVFLGLSAWTDLFTLAGGHRGELDALRTALVVAGCAFLVEFARTCWAAVGGRRVGRWILFVLLALAALGGFGRCARPGRDRRLLPRPSGRPLGRRRPLALPAGRRQARTPAAPGRRGPGPLRRGRMHRAPRGSAAAGHLGQPGVLPQRSRLPCPASVHGSRGALRRRPGAALPSSTAGGAPRARGPPRHLLRGRHAGVSGCDPCGRLRRYVADRRALERERPRRPSRARRSRRRRHRAGRGRVTDGDARRRGHRRL